MGSPYVVLIILLLLIFVFVVPGLLIFILIVLFLVVLFVFVLILIVLIFVFFILLVFLVLIFIVFLLVLVLVVQVLVFVVFVVPSADVSVPRTRSPARYPGERNFPNTCILSDSNALRERATCRSSGSAFSGSSLSQCSIASRSSMTVVVSKVRTALVYLPKSEFSHGPPASWSAVTPYT